MSARPPLGLFSLTALGVNGVVGVGIFVAPAAVASALPGDLGAAAYLVVAIGCLPIALTYARLARAMPMDGGPTLYAHHAFGDRNAHAIAAICWVSALFSTAAVTRALADSVSERFSSSTAAPALAVVISVSLAIVNLRGLSISAAAWSVLTVLKLIPLVALAAAGAWSVGLEIPSPVVPPLAPRSVGGALLTILFALQGFEIVVLPAGQSRDPAKAVPYATLFALMSSALLYALVHLACVRALPNLANVVSPIPEAARVLGGARLALAVRWGVTASIAGIVVGMHAMTPRYVSGLGPVETPSAPRISAVAVSAIAISVLVSRGSFSQLVNLASIAVLVQYGVTAVALLVLAQARVRGLRPGEAWPAIPALAVVGVLLLQARLREILLAAAVGVGGIVWSLWWRRGFRSDAA